MKRPTLSALIQQLLLVICLTPGALLADPKKETILWVTPSWHDITNGGGLFDEIIQSVFADSPYHIEKQIVPWKRALLLVASGDADMTGGEDFNPQHLQSEIPIQLLEESVLFRKSTLNWTGAASLRHIEGIWPIGYIDTFPDEYKQYLSGLEFSERDKSIDLILKTKRPIYYLDNKYHIERLLAKNYKALDRNDFEIKKLFEVPIFWRFANNERGKAIKAVFDERMSALLCTGKLDKLHGKHNSTMVDKTKYCG